MSIHNSTVFYLRCCRHGSCGWHRDWSHGVARCLRWADPYHSLPPVPPSPPSWTGCSGLPCGKTAWGGGRRKRLRSRRHKGPPWAPGAVCGWPSAHPPALSPAPWRPSPPWSAGQTDTAGRRGQHRSQRQSTEPPSPEDLEGRSSVVWSETSTIGLILEGIMYTDSGIMKICEQTEREQYLLLLEGYIKDPCECWHTYSKTNWTERLGVISHAQQTIHIPSILSKISRELVKSTFWGREMPGPVYHPPAGERGGVWAQWPVSPNTKSSDILPAKYNSSVTHNFSEQ